VDTINYVIAKTQQTLHSVMAPIEKWSNIIINHIEDFMKFGVKLLFMLDLFTCIGTGILDHYICIQSRI